MKRIGTATVQPVLPESLHELSRLARNLRWSWRPETERLFARIDPGLWEETGRNPIALLDSLPASRLRELEADERFLHRLHREAEDLDSYLSRESWFARQAASGRRGGPENASAPVNVAYFSMEFGIAESLPVYSGGLGVLAGDHLKSASDLGVPLTGIGLLYRYGYFSQTLSRDGWQQENYAPHPPRTLPVSAVEDADGKQLSVTIRFPQAQDVTAAVWKAEVGRVTLLLLDTDIEANPPELRGITDSLYGGDIEHRIRQELVLGVGGVRAVQAYAALTGAPAPTVFHLNEGHAGFSGVARIGQLVESGESFDAALARVRASTVFTTHTPVPAGIDRFEAALVGTYLGALPDGTSALVPGVPAERILALGREEDPGRFNMAHLGLRLAQRANGVAKLHGQVSREMFAPVFAPFEPAEVPITSVTNGVHIPTWVSAPMRPVISAISGGRELATADHWYEPDAVGSQELWRVRGELRAKLVRLTRQAVHRSWLARGAQDAELGWVQDVLDPEALTIGFARRVSTYKRLTLMLQEPARLAALLSSRERPVQFVIAGKAHPADYAGKQLLQELVRFADDAGVRERIVFLADYDVGIAKALVAGADVWLNNPVRPQEASGTSGMKAVLNGGLTLSISDGWWDELRDDRLGWTIPDAAQAHGGERDRLEASALYDLLERRVVPEFYERDEQGLPQAWLARMRASLAELGPQVSAERMVRDYTTQLYAPAAGSAARAAAPGAAREFAEWRKLLAESWSDISVHDVRAEDTAPVAGGHLILSAHVELGSLSADDVRVEAVVGGVDGERLVRASVHPMRLEGDGRFLAEIPVDRPDELGYTVRAVPQHPMLFSPAELGLLRTP